jgi:hypothetical protein
MYLGILNWTDYEETLTGPSIVNHNPVPKIPAFFRCIGCLPKYKMAGMFPEFKALHDSYGVVVREVQILDARMNLHVLLTAYLDGYL